MTTPSRIRIGVLGAAAIVPSALTNPARNVPEVQVTAIAARDPGRAANFARKHHIPRVHQTYEELLSDPEIDAIYNPLPNSLHAEWTIRALRAGKHVLCEKPFASNAKEALEMANAANETGKVLSEGFAYRYHPLTARIKKIIHDGELGKLKRIEVRFCFLLPTPGNIRFRYDLAGGALMDAGCYPVSLVRYLMSAEPAVSDAKAKLLKPDVDSRMEANLDFPENVRARVVCDMLSPKLFDSFLHVQGEAGEIRVINPYHPHWFHWLTVRTSKNSWRGRIRGDNVYALQLRSFAGAIHSGAPLNTTAEDAVNTMRVIDAIYEKAGLRWRGQ
ncbi:MAG TPA: Gfo/Idh/MocA family oxidoreductase [Anaerolineales bacterium]|nr:Gfo/Idh/MocA family oxidoreductase [Anaerolineales bacterium]